jgi:mannose/fructose/N-acetylgalactosamine-specific phosphotransferase system component IID
MLLLSHVGDSLVWRLVLVIILLVFASVAHVMGLATEVILLLITTVAGTAVQLTKPQKVR